MNIKKVLSVLKQDQSSGALRAARDQINLDALEQTVIEFEQQRAKLLLDGSDRDVDAIEKQITEANREVERAHAMHRELGARIEQAEAAEDQAARQAKYEAAKAENRKAKSALREYVKAASNIRECLVTLARAQIAIAEANAYLPDGCEPIIAEERMTRDPSLRDWRTPLIQEVNLPSAKPHTPAFWDAIDYKWLDQLGAARAIVGKSENGSHKDAA